MYWFSWCAVWQFIFGCKKYRDGSVKNGAFECTFLSITGKDRPGGELFTSGANREGFVR